MSFKTYQQGLKNATDLANRAIQSESALSTLSPLVSPLPVLQRTFPLYIASAEAYSSLLTSSLVPESERAGIKKKWRLVLERAEKIKARIEQLGGAVGRASVGDGGEEDNIVRRGGTLNGVVTELWNEAGPCASEFTLGREGVWRDAYQPPLAREQLERAPEWAEIEPSAWEAGEASRWRVKQGRGADCSVVAGVGVCIEHNARWKTKLGQSALYPQAATGQPKHAENGKHIVKLLLNGAWRRVVIDSLLPRAAATGKPLHATATTTPPSTSPVGPAWIPLSVKAYFKTLGGYDIRGSNPAPDIYAFTGWIPEVSSLRGGFQREKEWTRIYSAWKRGRVLVTLGTGESTPDRLVPLHAYGVLDMQGEDGERMLEIFDPGSARRLTPRSSIANGMDQLSISSAAVQASRCHRSQVFRMSWDEVCTEFETLNLNWDPAPLPVSAIRHWSWPKPNGLDGAQALDPRYRLSITTQSDPLPEVWILLSQHIVSKDRPLDDIGLHIFEEPESSSGPGTAVHPERAGLRSPYTNSLHLVVRYQLRRSVSSLLVIPSRDRGLHRTDFTLQAFAPAGTSVALDRVSRSLAFSQTATAELTARNSGGHSGLSSWMSNPQYRLVVLPPSGTVPRQAEHLKVVLSGDKGLAWNVKLLWGRGELVYEATRDSIVRDSGAYEYGVAYLDLPDVQPGTYTMVVSAFTPRQTGSYSLAVESSLPAKIEPLAPEGAGMYSRIASGSWTMANAAGRPSLGDYNKNPKIEIILPRASSIIIRIVPSVVLPINLTLFRRSSASTLGEQIATSGPYDDSLPGVLIGRTKVEAGVYLGAVSAWEAGMGVGVTWEGRVWSDGPLSVEVLDG